MTKPGGSVVIFAPNRLWPFETHGAYFGKRYVFGNIPLINWLPDPLRDRFAPHVRVYTREGHSLALSRAAGSTGAPPGHLPGLRQPGRASRGRSAARYGTGSTVPSGLPSTASGCRTSWWCASWRPDRPAVAGRPPRRSDVASPRLVPRPGARSPRSAADRLVGASAPRRHQRSRARAALRGGAALAARSSSAIVAPDRLGAGLDRDARHDQGRAAARPGSSPITSRPTAAAANAGAASDDTLREW